LTFTIHSSDYSTHNNVSNICISVSSVITAGQLKAARALLGIDQRTLAERAGLSVATIQRMERSEGVVRGTVDSLMKLVAALNEAGLELLEEGSPGGGRGRGVRLRDGHGAS
jgi:transcriptional regulator with XRE-family HTH domain